MSEIWRQCKGERHIRPLQGRLVRLVESQEQVATLQLVDTLEEQALLEELLESSKPPVPADAARTGGCPTAARGRLQDA